MKQKPKKTLSMNRPKENLDWLQIDKSSPNKNIIALAGLTGVLSCLDDRFGLETDWDNHLSVTNDLFGHYIYWRPRDIYIELISEYEQRIRPRVKNLVSDAVHKIDFVLKNIAYAIDFIADVPVFPAVFNSELSKIFIEVYYVFYGKFKQIISKKFPDLNIQRRIT